MIVHRNKIKAGAIFMGREHDMGDFMPGKIGVVTYIDAYGLSIRINGRLYVNVSYYNWYGVPQFELICE